MIEKHYTKEAIPGYIEPESLLLDLEDKLPHVIFLGGAGDHALLVLAGTEIPFNDVAGQSLEIRRADPGHSNFFSGIGHLGLLSYDEFAGEGRVGVRNRVFEVTESLVWERHARRMSIRRSTQRVGTRWVEASVLQHEMTKLQAEGLRNPASSEDGIVLSPLPSKETYENMVRQAIESIRDGNFYQINLLRFFAARSVTFRQLIARMPRWGGAMSSAWRIPGLELVSLSPERFVTVMPKARGKGGQLIAETRPIKGTAPRGETGLADRQRVDGLMTSEKERAELAMIIDLMRNDLNRICESGTVEVVSAGHIETLPYAHHRVGVVRGRLRPQLLGEFLETVLPGGSITGAPKRAAMEAIRRLEGRPRGYFMGNAFYWDSESGYLDASILIRSAYRESDEKGHWSDFEFAAGSGIVLDSDPVAEAGEVMTKCRVLTAGESAGLL